MNPQLHAEFVELCALFYTGELSDEEWALLQIHMAYCDDCRHTFEQYRHVAKELVPAMAAAAAAEHSVPHETEAALAHAERQLLDRVASHGTTPVARPAPVARGSWTRLLIPPVLSALAAGAMVAILFHVKHGHTEQHPLVPQANTPASVTIPTATGSPVRRDRDEGASELTALRQQLADVTGKSEQALSASGALQAKLTDEQAQRSALLTEKEALGTQLSSAQADVQRLQSELDATRGDANHRSVLMAELEGKVRTLNVALDEAQTALNDKERMLALDKDFLSHDRDIRDVIGARNLYIADIFDATETGRTAKPFGRIFYTQDRSLVFYGFDLEKKAGTKRPVAYQVWGSGTDRSPVSLGLFYQDDNHKRWVLRCSDAKTLARLNMVFVTTEPEGGSRTPTGQQFLRAYLQIQPNHP